MGFMQRRKRETRWDGILRDLVLPDRPCTTEVLAREYVEQVRGHTLVIRRDDEVVSPRGPSGMWMSYPSLRMDLFWIHPGAEGLHFDRIIGHELGHMAAGHEPDPVEPQDIARLLSGMCSHISPKLWEASLCRTSFDDPLEREAEDFSYFTEEWLRRPRRYTRNLLDNMRESLDTRW